MTEIPIRDIWIGSRKRPADPLKVQALAGSIQTIGLLHPITVRPNEDGTNHRLGFILVAGLHRLEAFKLLGLADISANVLTLDDLQARLVELDENLVRSNPTILQESLWLAERKEIYEALHPETRHGGAPGLAGGGKAKVENFSAFAQDTAAKLGVTDRTVRNRTRIGARLGDVADALLGSPIEDNQQELLRLARIAERETTQAQAVADKIAGGQARRVRDALHLVEQDRQRQAAAQLEETMPDVSDRYRLICADLADPEWEAWDIAPGSVSAVITDPPYAYEYLPLYALLAQRAAVWLKPGGSLVAMAGQSYLPEVIAALAAPPELTYRWTLAYLTPGGQSPQIWERRVNTFWKPVLWFVKGPYDGPWLGDVVKSDVNDNDKRFHPWGQSESGMKALVARFTRPGDPSPGSGQALVLDPFCGGGATGAAALALNLRFVGIDIDPDCIEQTKARLTLGQ